MDTIKIFYDSINYMQVIVPDTFNIKSFQPSVDPSTSEAVKNFLGFIAGIAAVCIGYLLNYFSDILKETKRHIIDFENQLLLFSKGQITFIEVLISYNKLSRRKRKKINIEQLKDIKDIIINDYLECLPRIS